ncbi:hypothetical protein V1U69_13445 [Vibrio alginolyticus]|uniref:hypothetical protein n=1 Tax=Vibrio alginolyticus TaxID=663 RepID=UPI0029992C8F|nr:hypothetical protein [Vibrio parahaemolyticus]
MSIITFPGYHACSQHGGYEQVRHGIPFLSEDSEEQWLTQGYYFWNHSAKFAKTWTPAEYRKGGEFHGQAPRRAIGQFEINLDESELWDLVGNPLHQEEFDRFAEKLLAKYKRARRNNDQVSVNEVIAEMREFAKQPQCKSAFPYNAVKAVDNRVKDISFYHFTPTKREGLQLPIGNAQQVCIFNKTEENVVLRSFIEPMDFKMKLIQEFSSQENNDA